ncbi:hypothetical protein NMY22_g9497 [Coprinellus aureogranulatus]|nr:hypothetical protein NMY22_g9497 [Coprinellus aureogranulatus]
MATEHPLCLLPPLLEILKQEDTDTNQDERLVRRNQGEARMGLCDESSEAITDAGVHVNVFAMNEGALLTCYVSCLYPSLTRSLPYHRNPPTRIKHIAFAQFAPSSSKDPKATSTLVTQKLLYIVCNLLTLGVGLWKCRSMGLLPTGSGDWLAFETRGPVKFSGGTFTLEPFSHLPWHLQDSENLEATPSARCPESIEMATIRVEQHAFQTPDSQYMPKGQGLWVCAKRYSTEESVKDTKGLTLLFTHCNGSSKEEWDIVISNLFKIQSSKDEPFRIREAWSFDRQNHGDAAVLNARALNGRKEGTLYLRLRNAALYEWALALTWFVRSPLLYGHRLVPFGHSAGTSAWMLTTTHFALDSIPYVSMFLVESTITPKDIFETELEERLSYMDLVVNLTLKRRDEWPNKEAALEYFGKRLPWSLWDHRALKSFVEHGLHDAPDTRRGVTLKWTKEQEASSYPDRVPHYESAVRLAEVSNVIPVHLIWGERIEFMPEYLRDALSDKSAGMNVASVSYIEDAGHMVVQEKPDTLAETIASKLDGIAPMTAKSKL